MNLCDLLAQTLDSLDRPAGEADCHITVLHTASLGRLEVEPGSLQQALTLLAGEAIRASARSSSLVIQAERFTDDFTEQDWVEISVPCPAPVTAFRQAHVEAILEEVGARLDVEAAAGGGSCVYRIYMPCTRILVPFPGDMVGLDA